MYICELCGYKVKERYKIHSHHIVPVEMKGSDKGFNRIYLCPNCHNRIYIPESIRGNHSKRSEDSIIIRDLIQSTAGTLIEYEENYNIKYKIMEN